MFNYNIYIQVQTIRTMKIDLCNQVYPTDRQTYVGLKQVCAILPNGSNVLANVIYFFTGALV